MGRHVRSAPLSGGPGASAALLLRPAPVVAPALLGWTLRSSTDEGVVSVVVTEVEAYHGGDDPASHAYRGRTRRNATMFGPAGRLYVYLSHGLHRCANVVCGPDEVASAVLLRAGRVVEGEELARWRREHPPLGRAPDRSLPRAALARGPGSLGRALGLEATDDGADLLDPGGRLELSRPEVDVHPAEVASGPRVGVSAAADRPWRFWVLGDPSVSAYRRSPRAPRPDAVARSQ